jgi:ABC-type Zn uptake system ZnuABC Zn-binding protein ZnuA
MKRILALVGLLSILLCGCGVQTEAADIAATTLPVYQFTTMLCEGTGLTVTRLVNESVSCLHDYSLQVSQVRAVEQARLIVISGAGLEDFMEDLLQDRQVIDASQGISLLESCHDHAHEHEGHHHEHDAHIWLSPVNAMVMAQNICRGLCAQFPEHKSFFEENLNSLLLQLQDLQNYAEVQLRDLSSRELITFHDGFSYLAQAFDLQILAAVEEESGAETSAKELIRLIELVQQHDLGAIFTEQNGFTASAAIISRETGAAIFTLDMAISGNDYFAAMYHNIQTIREALQ